MTSISAKVVGTKQIAARWAKRGPAVQVSVNRETAKYTQLMQTRIQAHASGRPGPNAPTGDYLRSWTTSYRMHGKQLEGTTGTNKDQGRRLEFGFHGQDSLGRSYNQPPYPHVGPAVDEIVPKYKLAIEKTLVGL